MLVSLSLSYVAKLFFSLFYTKKILILLSDNDESIYHVSMFQCNSNLFFSSINRVALTTASGSEADAMTSELTSATPRRRSSILVIPEGKPAFAQPLESELLINEDEQLTYVSFDLVSSFSHSYLFNDILVSNVLSLVIQYQIWFGFSMIEKF